MHYLSFGHWLMSLNTMSSTFIHVLAGVRVSFLSEAEYIEADHIVWTDSILLISSAFSGHLGGFLLLGLVNNTVLNTGVQMSL